VKARLVLGRAGHLALWAGLYAGAAVVCLGQTAGVPGWESAWARWDLLVYAWATAAAVYLLDRVKLADRWLDPADAAAHPRRYAFLARRAGRVRGLAAILIAVALAAGARAGWVAPAMCAAAAAGVVLYAGRPRRERPRVKDVLILKNLYVAGGITGFAVLVALLAHGGGASLRDGLMARPAALAAAAALLLVRVAADAALCDLDDESADRAHRTATLPVWLGRYPAWNAAMALRLLVAAALLIPYGGPARARLLWAAATAASSIALRLWRPARVRDVVDARFAVEAVVVSALLAVV
jgi:hypothetical protein